MSADYFRSQDLKVICEWIETIISIMISYICFKFLSFVYCRQRCGFLVAPSGNTLSCKFPFIAMQYIFPRRKACLYSDWLVVQASRQYNRLVLLISSVSIVQASSDFSHTKIFGSSCRCTHLNRCKKGVKRKTTTGNSPGQLTSFLSHAKKKPEKNNAYLCIYGFAFIWKSKR